MLWRSAHMSLLERLDRTEDPDHKPTVHFIVLVLGVPMVTGRAHGHPAQVAAPAEQPWLVLQCIAFCQSCISSVHGFSEETLWFSSFTGTLHED